MKKVLQYYNYSVKKQGAQGPDIKHIYTQKDIDEESKEIDMYLKSKDAHKSKDSNLSDDSDKSLTFNRYVFQLFQFIVCYTKYICRSSLSDSDPSETNSNNLLQSRDLAQSVDNLTLEADEIEYRRPSVKEEDRRRSRMTDAEYMAEIKNICNPGNPLDYYEKTLKDLGNYSTSNIYFT